MLLTRLDWDASYCVLEENTRSLGAPKKANKMLVKVDLASTACAWRIWIRRITRNLEQATGEAFLGCAENSSTSLTRLIFSLLRGRLPPESYICLCVDVHGGSPAVDR